MIRTAMPEEFPQLLNMQISCIRDLTETYTAEEINNWIGYLERQGKNRYEEYENRVYTDDDNHIAGFVSWSQNESESTASLECLYTLKEYRGQGIGKLLLAEAEREISQSVTIAVRSTLNARSFYEQQSYHYIQDATSRAGFKIALLEKANEY